MVALRSNGAPIRTRDSGATWEELDNFPNVTTPQYSRAGEYSWSGKTLVVHGEY